MEPWLDFASDHECRFAWSVVVSLELADSNDRLWRQVEDLVLNSERLMQFDSLDLALVLNPDLQGPRDKVDGWWSHTAWNRFTGLPWLRFTSEIYQRVFIEVVLSHERAPFEVQFWEQLNLLETVELFKKSHLVRYLSLRVLHITGSRISRWSIVLEALSILDEAFS